MQFYRCPSWYSKCTLYSYSLTRHYVLTFSHIVCILIGRRENLKDIGYNAQALVAARTRLGRTQKQISEEVGVHVKTIGRIEHGTVASYRVLCKMGEVLNIPIAQIIYLEK